MHDFVSSALGGAVIGLAASLLFLTHGRIAGISGLLASLLSPDWQVGAAFVVGLLGAGVAARALDLPVFDPTGGSLPLALAAGLLVGFGSRLSGGCTSGHGVCGLSRLSRRSIAATVTFTLTAIATVFVARHVL